MSAIIAGCLGGGGAAFNLFADSKGGSDANSGTSAALAVQNLPALVTKANARSGARVGLKGGSTWTGSIKPAAGFAVLGVYQ